MVEQSSTLNWMLWVQRACNGNRGDDRGSYFTVRGADYEPNQLERFKDRFWAYPVSLVVHILKIEALEKFRQCF